MDVSTRVEPHVDRPYGEVLRLEELLQVAHVNDERVERMLFLSTHQSCEIWFAVVLRHLEAVRTALEGDDAATAVRLLRRMPPVFEALTRQFAVLATLGADDFNEIRESLGSASGFQSVMFREIEFLSGLRDDRYLSTPGFSVSDRDRLLARKQELSVEQAYQRFADRNDGIRTAADVERVRAALHDMDEAVMIWRARHAVLAERLIGGSPGTVGTDGAQYLWRAARRRLFPTAWVAG